MYKQAVIGAFLAIAVSVPSWAGVQVTSVVVTFGGVDWVVNTLRVDTGGAQFTNAGLFVDPNGNDLIYQEDSTYDPGQPTTRPAGKLFHSPFGSFNETDFQATLNYDTFVENGLSDANGTPSQIAGKSGLDSLVDPSNEIFDANTLDIAWFDTTAGSGDIRIAQITLKTNANNAGGAVIQAYAGGASPVAEDTFDIVDGVIGGAVPPVVPVPAAAVFGLPLLGLASIMRRRLIG